MTQAPSAYSSFPGDPIGEQKTSIMAIVSLVCSLVCFVPGLSVVGVILGVLALLMIANSNGKLGGRGLAIAGLIFGLVVSAFWITVLIGAMQVSKVMKGQFAQPLGQLMLDIDAKDFTKARQSLTPAAAAAITDADFSRFVDSYQGELGHAKAPPDNIIEFVMSYGKLGQQMQQFQGGGQDVIPFPGNFDNGMSVIAFQVDHKGGPGPQMQIPISNIMVITPSGKKVTLYDPGANASSPMSMPAPPSVPEAPGDSAPSPTRPGGG